ncbi:hypothetical protein DOTSEDRAFT_123261 [Dothistroma septosporum NZE10]|uniref:Uncharacterized protein n=1 Tax=Dothistroma septosporum (strain NZE10 / CBS 128990) TaxID=675120 RepID=N1PWU1_DOTSN|nr:hypothetical protein DOTSEDRAFT_123261 [Dothistroma septosporum NZE10]
MVDFSDSTTQYAAGVSLLALIAAFLMVQPTPLVKWLQKKNYQYEVTFSLYMLTPTEKFVFNSVLFLTLSMVLIATIVYLPGHVKFLTLRAYYYMSGDAALVTSSRQAADKLMGSATEVLDAASGWYHAAINGSATTATAAAAKEAATQVAEGLKEVVDAA